MSYANLFDKDKLLCACNNVTIGEAVEFIKNHDFKNLEEWMASDEPVGDKCEACIENGTENDGINLACVFARVKQGQL